MGAKTTPPNPVPSRAMPKGFPSVATEPVVYAGYYSGKTRHSRAERQYQKGPIKYREGVYLAQENKPQAKDNESRRHNYSWAKPLNEISLHGTHEPGLEPGEGPCAREDGAAPAELLAHGLKVKAKAVEE